MNEAIRKLEPTAMWNNFADLNAVPRPSKKEERLIAFAKGLIGGHSEIDIHRGRGRGSANKLMNRFIA